MYENLYSVNEILFKKKQQDLLNRFLQKVYTAIWQGKKLIAKL